MRGTRITQTTSFLALAAVIALANPAAAGSDPIEPSSSDDHLRRARSYLEQLETASIFKKLGLSKKVREHYLKAIELDPNNLDARESLAFYYFEAPGIAGGSTEKGMQQVEAIRARDRQRGHRVLGWHYREKEQYDRAEQEYRAALALKADDLDTLYRMGELFQLRERWTDAVTWFDKALAVEPDDLRTHYAVGRTAALSGTQLDRGITSLTRYLELPAYAGLPGHTYAEWRLGMIYEHKGEIAKARASYQAAIELDADNDRARDALKKLR